MQATRSRSRTVVGIGLLAQDVVFHHNSAPASSAGGSCGNVLALLAWLGWQAIPIARIGDDPPGKFVRGELERLGVTWNHVQHSVKLGTPTIIQEFVSGPMGQLKHRFRIACPTCRQFLPRYTPPTITVTATALESLSAAPDILYFDRVSPAAVFAARWVSERGGIVVFEPSAVHDPRLFKRALKFSHIVKYSSEHSERLREVLRYVQLPIQIETLGEQGLRYRTCVAREKSDWFTLDAYPLARFRDAAGAGDCCTAALLHGLIDNYGRVFSDQSILRRCLDRAQALASINCSYIGARGIMAAMSAPSAIDMASRVSGSGKAPTLPLDTKLKRKRRNILVCRACATNL
jgi:sugar/nucleoside kinase (ribokinase family)